MFCTKCGSQVADGQKFCTVCGALLDESSAKAQQPASPAPQPVNQAQQPAEAYQQNSYQQQPYQQAPYQQSYQPQPKVVYYANDDVASLTERQKSALVKFMAIICYIPILFLIPLFIFDDKPFIRSHANNGLVLSLFLALFALFLFIETVGLILFSVFAAFQVIVSIMCIISIINGTTYDIPVLDKIKIVK